MKKYRFLPTRNDHPKGEGEKGWKIGEKRKINRDSHVYRMGVWNEISMARILALERSEDEVSSGRRDNDRG